MEDCIFCKIAKKEIKSEIVYEDEEIVAFKDVNPQAPVHILVIPKKHIPTIDEIGSQDFLLIGKLVDVGRKLANQFNLKNGYRLIFNCKQDAGQAVFHIHLHLLGGRRFHWPPG